ncbi:hypothetical protein JQ575_43035 [Bradyrhizobium sp. JYMT SZCCT0428]|nr:hypothetical protein [Bradyrhizobium sp. JYMT SZCCT0428]
MTAMLLAAIAGMLSTTATAGPSAETARRCQHYSYVVYPYKRPGSVRMSGDRQSYFKDCMAKEGKVPEPTPAKS